MWIGVGEKREAGRFGERSCFVILPLVLPVEPKLSIPKKFEILTGPRWSLVMRVEQRAIKRRGHDHVHGR